MSTSYRPQSGLYHETRKQEQRNSTEDEKLKQQQSIFQKYSRISSNVPQNKTNTEQTSQVPQAKGGKTIQSSQLLETNQNNSSIPQLNIQTPEQQIQQSQRQSLIQKVFKETNPKDTQQQGKGIFGVQRSDSKIAHQMGSQSEQVKKIQHHQKIQTRAVKNQERKTMLSGNTHQIKLVNHLVQHQGYQGLKGQQGYQGQQGYKGQQIQQGQQISQRQQGQIQNTMRHTIGASQHSSAQGQQNLRGNYLIQNKTIMNQQKTQIRQGSISSNSQSPNVFLRGSLPPMINSNPNVSHVSPQQNQFNMQGYYTTQQKYRAEDLLQQPNKPVQRLQQSQIVYTNRQNNQIRPQTQPQKLYQQQKSHIKNAHYRNTKEQSYRSESQPMRQENRSTSRRNTTVLFNYNSQNSSMVQPLPTSQPQRQASTSQPQRHPPQTTKPHSLSPNPGSNSLPLEQVIQPQQYSQLILPVNRSQAKVSQSQMIWKERYFELYERCTQMNISVETITEEFYIYEKMMTEIKREQISQKYYSRHQKISQAINTLQQQISSIIHQHGPNHDKTKQNSSDNKVNKAFVQSGAQLLDQKQQQIYHLDKKYKRLLYTYSKLQQENTFIKRNFEKKIHQVVKKLEEENSTLRNQLQILTTEVMQQSQQIRKSEGFQLLRRQSQRIRESQRIRNSTNIGDVSNEMKVGEVQRWVISMQDIITTIEQQNKAYQELQNRYLEAQHSCQELQQHCQQLQRQCAQKQNLLEQSNRQPTGTYQLNSTQIGSINNKLIQLSDQLQLSLSQNDELSRKLAEYQQKTTILSSQVERMAQKTIKLSTSMRQKQTQLIKLRQSTRLRGDTDNNSLGRNKQQNQFLMRTLNQYKDKIDQIQEKMKLVEKENRGLKEELSIKGSSDKINYSQENISQQMLKLAETSKIHIQTLQHQNTTLQSQNTALKQQIIQLKDQINKVNQQSYNQLSSSQPPTQQNNLFQGLKNQYEFTISMLRAEIERKENEIDREARLSEKRVEDLLKQLEIAYKERESMMKRYEQKVQALEVERDQKEGQIRQLRDKVYEVEQSRRMGELQQSRKAQYISRAASLSNQQQSTRLRQQLQTLQQAQIHQTKQYNIQIQTLTNQLNQLKQDNARLKRQISQFANSTQQIDNLNQQLNKKNYQILSLKDRVFEGQKLELELGNVKRQLGRVVQERDQLTEEKDQTLREKNQLKRKVGQTEQKLNAAQESIKTLQEEKQLMSHANTRKDQEISKLRQSNQLLQANIEELQHKLQTQKSQHIDETRQYEQTITTLRTQISHYQSKQADYDQLIKQKSLSQYRIGELQGQNQKLTYQLKQNQELVVKQKGTIKLRDSEIQDLNAELNGFEEKVKQWEKKYSEAQKKYKKVVEELQDKNKALSERQLKFQKEKIVSLEQDLKVKDNKIWKLQKDIEELEERLDGMGDQQLDAQRILTLESKVKEYEARLFNQTFKYNPTNYDYHATKVFQRQVIYQLKEENEQLREFISGMSKRIKQKQLQQQQHQRPTSDKIQQLVGSKQRIQQIEQSKKVKEAYDEEINQVEDRLKTFNRRLEKLINGGELSLERSRQDGSHVNGGSKSNQEKLSKSISKHKKSSSPSKSRQSIEQVEILQQQQYNASQLRQLKLKYGQLQRYCKTIQSQLLSSESINNPINNHSRRGNLKSNTTITVLNNQKQYSRSSNYYNQALAFQKQKNLELEQRVEKLLKMNHELKENVENLLKRNNDSSTVEYYKEQAWQLGEKVKTLESRISKLIQDNQKLRSVQIELGSGAKESDALKVYELERKVIELQHLSTEHQRVRRVFEKDLDNYKELLKSKDLELKELGNKLALKGEKQASSLSALREKLQIYELQLSKQTNKTRLLQSQLQRVNQSLNKKQKQSTTQNTQLYHQHQTLQKQYEQKQIQLQQLQKQLIINQNEQHKLNLSIKNKQYEIEELRSAVSGWEKRFRQLQDRYQQNETLAEELRQQLLVSRGTEAQATARIQHLEVELTKCTTEAQFLQAEIQRLTENHRTKCSNYQSQIYNLQKQVQLRETTFVKVNKNMQQGQKQKQDLEEQVSKQYNQIILLKNQIERLNQSIKQKQNQYQDKSIRLKTQINELEHNNHALKQEKQQFSILIQENQNSQIKLRDLKNTLRQLENDKAAEIEQKNQLRTQLTQLQTQLTQQQIQCSTLQSQVADFAKQTHNYQQQIINYKQQITNYEQQITKLYSQKTTLSQEVTRLQQQIHQLQQTNSSKHQESSGNAQQLLRLQQQVQKYQRQIQQYKLQLSSMKQHNQEQLSLLKQHYQEQLSSRKQHYQERIQQQIQSFRQFNVQLSYYIELSRSFLLEIDVLIDQRQLVHGKQQTDSINNKLGEEIHKGLINVEQTNKLIKEFSH